MNTYSGAREALKRTNNALNGETMSDVYFIKPKKPNCEQLLKIETFLEEMGFNLSYLDSRIYLKQEAGNIIRKYGMTKLLSDSQLMEEVLPDGGSSNVLKDTLRYKLKLINAQNELLIIDPYLFPQGHDSDYIELVKSIFSDTLNLITQLHVVTKTQRNQSLENEFHIMVNMINPNITITTKYSSVFHDRFWILDKEKGIFIGTSLNGIGNRYAVIDYLNSSDTNEIYARFKQLA